MHWLPLEHNDAEDRLTKTAREVSFGWIQRDPVARKAQILWFNPETSKQEYVDLVDYRYGMDKSQIDQDIEMSGLSVAEWEKTMKIIVQSVADKFNSTLESSVVMV